jgi:N6-L-threonylcarbamoyladenine synthase
MIILGIETSCDETAAAVVTGDRRILSNVVLSQTKEHLAYGGVVPEIAARAHMDYLDEVISRALAEAKLGFESLDAVAATAGPGLIGGVIVGLMTAKAIASSHRKPLIAVNHLEGHALTVRLTEETQFPYLLLLVSGGHCQFLMVEGVGRYQRLGGTMDDALGEAFDKTAKLLGLGYPGGPAVERLAARGNPSTFAFSQPLKGRPGCDFSFSGLKTSVRTVVKELEAQGALSEQVIDDICASFQQVVAATVCERTDHAVAMAKSRVPELKTLVLAGGVAANQSIRRSLEALCAAHGMSLHAPPIALCTDNAAMIAWAGIERLRLGLVDDLSFEPRARWPLAS